MEDNLKRINKFIGETGYCSRREADQLIADGRVTINGNPAEMGTKVSPDDEIRIDGKLIRDNNENLVYLAFNKPVGIECTTNLEVPENIVDYINYPKRIFPIGRLDKASEGLIFMTNDGDIVNKILRARNNHEKEYTVTVDKPITSRFIERMGNGVPILDTVTRKCKVEQISKYNFKIILTQGLNRQIRRMCEYLGYEVTALKRIRIINISLDLPVGRYRELTAAEIAELNLLIEPSSKTEEASLPKPESRTTSAAPRERNPEPRIQREEPSGTRTPRDWKSGIKSRKPEGENEKREEQCKPEQQETRVRREGSANRNLEVRSYHKPATENQKPETDHAKPAADKREAKSVDKAQERPDSEERDKPQPSRWKVDFIKKDDPAYKKRGEY